jgi:hypothetical protein
MAKKLIENKKIFVLEQACKLHKPHNFQYEFLYNIFILLTINGLSLNNPKSLYIQNRFNPPIVVILCHDESRNSNGQSRFHLMTKVRTYKQINKWQTMSTT